MRRLGDTATLTTICTIVAVALCASGHRWLSFAWVLTAAAGGVKVGGRLVYATCSSEPDENEAVVTEFLRSHPQFEQIHPLRSDTDRDVPSGLQAVVNDEGYLRTYPHVHGLEAFFGAVLRRLR